jgi:hypothetical protein
LVFPVTNEKHHYRMPKRDLVSVMQVLLQGNWMKIARGRPETKTLVKELLNFAEVALAGIE